MKKFECTVYDVLPKQPVKNQFRKAGSLELTVLNIYSVVVFQYRNCFYSRSVKFLFYNVWTKPELSPYHLLLSVKHLDMFRGSLELNITRIQFAEHFLKLCELDFKPKRLYKCIFVIKVKKDLR